MAEKQTPCYLIGGNTGHFGGIRGEKSKTNGEFSLFFLDKVKCFHSDLEQASEFLLTVDQLSNLHTQLGRFLAGLEPDN